MNIIHRIGTTHHGDRSHTVGITNTKWLSPKTKIIIMKKKKKTRKRTTTRKVSFVYKMYHSNSHKTCINGYHPQWVSLGQNRFHIQSVSLTRVTCTGTGYHSTDNTHRWYHAQWVLPTIGNTYQELVSRVSAARTRVSHTMGITLTQWSSLS